MLRKLLSTFTPFVLVGSALAATEPTTIQTTGEAQILRPADSLHLEVPVYCEAADLREALQQLDARRKAVAADVVKLGARSDSVSFDNPRIVGDAAPTPPPTPELTPDATELRDTSGVPQPTVAEPTPAAPPAELLALLNKPAAATEPAERTFLVEAVLKADFPIEGKSADERLVAVTELQDRIRTADLPGLAELKRIRESRSAGRPATNQRCLCGLGHPTVTFRSTISDDDRKTLFADAVAQAKHKADGLATAAGLQIANLSSLSEVAAANDPAGNQAVGPIAASLPITLGDDTSSTMNSTIAHRVKVHATYRIAEQRASSQN